MIDPDVVQRCRRIWLPANLAAAQRADRVSMLRGLASGRALTASQRGAWTSLVASISRRFGTVPRSKAPSPRMAALATAVLAAGGPMEIFDAARALKSGATPRRRPAEQDLTKIFDAAQAEITEGYRRELAEMLRADADRRQAAAGRALVASLDTAIGRAERRESERRRRLHPWR